MSKGVLLALFAFVLVALSHGSELSLVSVKPNRPGADLNKELPLPAVRQLLGGPADAFNEATKAHHHTKESSRPSKTTGVSGSATPAVSTSSDELNTLGGASSVQGDPADAFNKAARSRHSRKEAATPSKAIGVVPTKPQEPTTAAAAPPSTLSTPRQLLDTTTGSSPSGRPTEVPNKVPNKAVRVHTHRTTKKTPAPINTTGVTPGRSQSTTKRTLLGSPADVFNKATHSHHATKEAATPGKATGVTPDQPQQQLPTPTSPPPKQQPVSSANTTSGPASASRKVIRARHTTKKASAHDTTTAANKRTLLGGPADAFNKATHSHHATKEAAMPGKAVGITPDQPQQLPTPASAPAKRNLLSTYSAQSGPAEAFNKAVRARHATKEASKPGKTTGARPTTTTPSVGPTTVGSIPAQSTIKSQKPSSTGSQAVTEPGSRALLQWGWSGSSASASASAQAGSGGWGGNSWSGAQAQAQAQSQSFGGRYGGFGGYGWGRKLRAAAPSRVAI